MLASRQGTDQSEDGATVRNALVSCLYTSMLGRMDHSRLRRCGREPVGRHTLHMISETETELVVSRFLTTS